MPILGQQACESLDLVWRIDTVQQPLVKADLFKRCSDVFTGVGQYEEEYDIKVDDTVTPVIQPARKVPYACRNRLKQTLDSLEQQGIITSINRPTDWVHNLVIVKKKSGALKLCLDPKPLNATIKREWYVIPTPEDVHSKFHRATTFAVLDMKDAF